jgi:hypothetical protein
VGSNAANGELCGVVAEVGGSLGDDRLALPLTYATLSERKARIVVGPPDGGHIGSLSDSGENPLMILMMMGI